MAPTTMTPAPIPTARTGEKLFLRAMTCPVSPSPGSPVRDRTPRRVRPAAAAGAASRARPRPLARPRSRRPGRVAFSLAAPPVFFSRLGRGASAPGFGRGAPGRALPARAGASPLADLPRRDWIFLPPGGAFFPSGRALAAPDRAGPRFWGAWPGRAGRRVPREGSSAGLPAFLPGAGLRAAPGLRTGFSPSAPPRLPDGRALFFERGRSPPSEPPPGADGRRPAGRRGLPGRGFFSRSAESLMDRLRGWASRGPSGSGGSGGRATGEGRASRDERAVRRKGASLEGPRAADRKITRSGRARMGTGGTGPSRADRGVPS